MQSLLILEDKGSKLVIKSFSPILEKTKIKRPEMAPFEKYTRIMLFKTVQLVF